jgi:hypothetical protein
MVCVYHETLHSGVNSTPLQRWMSGNESAVENTTAPLDEDQVRRALLCDTSHYQPLRFNPRSYCVDAATGKETCLK